jgi:hypothetical protein
VIGTISYSLDGAGLSSMGLAQMATAGFMIPIVGFFPILGATAGDRTHRFWFTSNTASNWTVSGGFVLLLELKK